jgi:hypothetical protein
MLPPKAVHFRAAYSPNCLEPHPGTARMASMVSMLSSRLNFPRYNQCGQYSTVAFRADQLTGMCTGFLGRPLFYQWPQPTTLF